MAKTVSSLEQYAENQRAQYDATSSSRENAERQVAPYYDVLRDAAPNYVKMMLSQYSMVSGRPANIKEMSFLDFGCGVGRVMEAAVEMGAARVDGADISKAMLSHAKKSTLLGKSTFFLTSGLDAGDAPAETYDIAYSFLCLHHIPMRQTRLRIIEALRNSIKPGGMIFIEFKFFPGVQSHKIPNNHVSWSENRPAKYTNSRCDVWITPDTIGEVYQDFSLFFSDIFIIEAEIGKNHFDFDPDAIYQYAFNPVFIGGFKTPTLYGMLSKKP